MLQPEFQQSSWLLGTAHWWSQVLKTEEKMPELLTRDRKHMKAGRASDFSCYKGQLLVSADKFMSVTD